MSPNQRILFRQNRIRKLSADRARRIRLMHRKGFIHQETIFPEDSIPIDVEESTWVKLTIPELCYRDIEFSCRDCGKNETWQAHEQQFYFEVIKASPHARPVRCYACRKIERERKNEARRRAGHLEK